MEAFNRYKPNTLKKKFCAKWNISPRQFRKYYKQAENRLLETYQRNFQLDRAKEISALDNLIAKAWQDLDTQEKTVRSSKRVVTMESGADGRTVTNSEVKNRKQRGRMGIYSVLVKAMELRSKIKGLHRPEVFGGGDDVVDIMEISVTPITDDKGNGDNGQNN